MKKTTKGLVMLTTAMVLLALAGEAFGFCVYNRTNRDFHVEQTSGGKFAKDFSADLSPGEHGCCHWSNGDCNADGGKMDTLVFKVTQDGATWPVTLCGDVKIPACGWIEIKGQMDEYYRCEAYSTCD